MRREDRIHACVGARARAWTPFFRYFSALWISYIRNCRFRICQFSIDAKNSIVRNQFNGMSNGTNRRGTFEHIVSLFLVRERESADHPSFRLIIMAFCFGDFLFGERIPLTSTPPPLVERRGYLRARVCRRERPGHVLQVYACASIQVKLYAHYVYSYIDTDRTIRENENRRRSTVKRRTAAGGRGDRGEYPRPKKPVGRSDSGHVIIARHH